MILQASAHRRAHQMHADKQLRSMLGGWQAADAPDRDDESNDAKQQQPRFAIKGEQHSRAKDGRHEQPGETSVVKFHRTDGSRFETWRKPGAEFFAHAPRTAHRLNQERQRRV